MSGEKKRRAGEVEPQTVASRLDAIAALAQTH
jgi:hypothetical protein